MRWTRQLLFATLCAFTLCGCSCQSENTDSKPTTGDGVFPGWEVTFQGVSCRHPDVRRDCSEGWCRIPPGCFLMGSPETEWGRGLYTEDLNTVTITRSFMIGEREVTQAQWTALRLPNPSGAEDDGRDCLEPDCPVGRVTWFDTLAFANLLSQRHDPPLPPCYELEGCTGELGRQLACKSITLTTPTLYECSGFRLPTEAEWEYAARAGTRTAFFTGDITPQAELTACAREPKLDDIAWYCQNSSGSTHPTGTKRPNSWGLFDALGNAFEWVHDDWSSTTIKGPLTDPVGTYAPRVERVRKGGTYNGWPSLLRAAESLGGSADLGGPGLGFRLVRSASSRDE